jgi:hypothetical protein
MNELFYAAFADELVKIAEADAVTDAASAVNEGQTPPPYREHPALTLAKGVGGYALGAGAGYVGMHGLNRGIQALGGDGLPLAVMKYGPPVAASAAGLGFGLLQHRMMDRLKKSGAPPQNPLTEPHGGLDQDPEI